MSRASDQAVTAAASPRQRLKAERTDLLLREAARLFAQRGYRGVSLEELASAVGVSGPALYRHFPNKEAILAEVLRDVSRRLRDGGQVRVAEAASPQEALEALVDFHADFALGETDHIRVHNRDLRTLADDASGQVRKTQREYVELWVDQLVAVQGIDRELARLKCQAAIGLLNSTPHSVRHGDPEIVKPVLVQMTLAALLS
ncbi:TetR family transcriptional regulator [Epidermidibacterium keratini]|uniref:TetR family transcriptional regulator n=1 Tax=Epidermidibacterium keratini TaxID=1891644 RepID=A0A7L4YLM7_9ACTN|nr:TetR/AcrR family transcriptional regulator [Epidermidibacterium keratini]QHC00185.1 TetR family transcriptional regulator [Epidermidibacterium keratini]